MGEFDGWRTVYKSTALVIKSSALTEKDFSASRLFINRDISSSLESQRERGNARNSSFIAITLCPRESIPLLSVRAAITKFPSCTEWR